MSESQMSYTQGEDEIDFLRERQLLSKFDEGTPEFLISEKTAKTYEQDGLVQKMVSLTNADSQTSIMKGREFAVITAYLWGPDQWFWTMIHEGRRVVVKTCKGGRYGSCFRVWDLHNNRMERDVVACNVPDHTDRSDAQASRNTYVTAVDIENRKASNSWSTRSSGKATLRHSTRQSEDSDNSSDDSEFMPPAGKRRKVSVDGTIDTAIQDSSVKLTESSSHGSERKRQSRTSLRAGRLLDDNVKGGAKSSLVRSATRTPNHTPTRPFDATALANLFTCMATKLGSDNNLSCKIEIQSEDDFKTTFEFDVRDPIALDAMLSYFDKAPAAQSSIKIELMRGKAA